MGGGGDGVFFYFQQKCNMMYEELDLSMNIILPL